MPKRHIYDMSFLKVYALLVQKAERKGRTKEEVDEVICWLTGYSQPDTLNDLSYREFFENAPDYNHRAELISGSVCGVKVQEIEEPLMKKIRQLDKLVDELAKGWALEKIKR